MTNMIVTNCVRGDGFGAQYQNIIWAILYAELNNHEFYYTPFNSMEHNYENDFEFLIKKENLINIINTYPTVSELPSDTIVKELCGGVNGVCFNIIENDLTGCSNLNSFKKIKKALHMNKEPMFNNDILNIAVHVRKKNSHDNHTLGICGDDYFLGMIDYIRKNYDGEKIFHIYSQGEEKDFLRFKNDDVLLHLNEPIESTFYSMVTAQILVMSKSSLSYTAGMLSDGIVYYLPFWHKPASNWKIIKN
jgi:hypothetical protein